MRKWMVVLHPHKEKELQHLASLMIKPYVVVPCTYLIMPKFLHFWGAIWSLHRRKVIYNMDIYIWLNHNDFDKRYSRIKNQQQNNRKFGTALNEMSVSKRFKESSAFWRFARSLKVIQKLILVCWPVQLCLIRVFKNSVIIPPTLIFGFSTNGTVPSGSVPFHGACWNQWSKPHGA